MFMSKIPKKLPKKFYFQHHLDEETVYRAIQVGSFWHVSWDEESDKDPVKYSKGDVEVSLGVVTGNWIILDDLTGFDEGCDTEEHY